MKRLLLLLAAGAAPVLAQRPVGHEPASSPYRDTEWRHQVIPFAGVLRAARDVAGVGPRTGAMLGVRYDVGIGGPMQFTARLAYADGERTVKDPVKPAATRVVGSKGSGLLLADVGVTMALTGRKAWHGLAPTMGAGFGLASDLDARPDVGGYFFGSKFAFNFGPGVRIVTGKRLEWRLDATRHLWQLRYPQRYRTEGAGVTPLVPSTRGLNSFAGNWALTVGGAWGYLR